VTFFAFIIALVIGFCKIQVWACNDCFAIPCSLATCKIPLCIACQFAAAQKCPDASSTCTLANHTLNPSKFISVNHMVSGTGGHIPFQIG